MKRERECQGRESVYVWSEIKRQRRRDGENGGERERREGGIW